MHSWLLYCCTLNSKQRWHVRHKQPTSLATDSLTASGKVKGFPDCQLRQVLILLLDVNCCALRQELSQGSAIVQDLAVYLETTVRQLAS